ncbi:MAG: hypothetical protein M3P40_12870 [Actinomycetota bacterium]|nr:hypothetical protein [Actinomycetota bacterium]
MLGHRDHQHHRAGRRTLWTSGGNGIPVRVLVAGCLALAALSLLGPGTPTYDPWAWIIWGREITEWNLVTTYGPSWKPLPVFFTTLFALFGEDAAPALWLMVARAGGLLAIAMSWRLASRLAGWPAGLVAGLSLVLADDFVGNFARGNSEGILVAVSLWAVDRHLDGRRRSAFALGFSAALLRPEVWPFFGLYGLWLLVRDPGGRLLVIIAFLATPVLWFVPEYIGSGEFLRAAERALHSSPSQPANSEYPFLAVFARASGLLAPPVLLGAVIAVVLAFQAGKRQTQAAVVIALAGVATAVLVVVAAMAQAGFAGNLRYVALSAALVCVLAGVGWSWAASFAAERYGRRAALAGAAVALVASVPFLLVYGGSLQNWLSATARQAGVVRDLDRAIARSGGAAAAERCGGVYTGPYEVQLMAWKLHRHGREVGLDPRVPGTIYARLRHSAEGDADPGFRRVAVTDHWMVSRACGS